MKCQTYFHIGCTYKKEDILRSLLNLGFHVIVVDEIGIRPTKVDIPYVSVFGKSYEDILNTIKDFVKEKCVTIQDCHFFTLAEGSVDLLNQLLKNFGKPPISQYSGSLRDKYWVRQRLEEFSIGRLPFLSLAKNPAEIPIPTKDKFPLIVKPVGSMASRNVFKVRDNDELRKACLEIFTKNKTFLTVDHGEIVIEEVYGQNAFALIESVLHGEKISIEVLVDKGTVLFQALVAKFDYDNIFFYERADILYPNYLDEDATLRLRVYIKSLVSALQIESSLLHIEIFFDRKNSQFNLIEVNFRLGGDRIPELVSKAYGLNLVAEFLQTLSDQKANNELSIPSKIDLSQAWIAFYFLTGEGGEFEIRKKKAFGHEIEWHFSNGEKISKFNTSKFFMIGTVVFTAPKKEIESRLNHLFEGADGYFALKKIDPEFETGPIVDLKKSRRDAFRLLRVGLSILYFSAFTMGGLYLYRSFETQSKVLGETLAKTLAYHLANGEIYYVANIVHNFETGRIYGKIAVADSKNKVIYASSLERPYSLFYQEKLDPRDYDQAIPIRVDGIDIGILVYDVNYHVVAVRLLVGFFLFSTLVAGLYFVIAKYLFNRVAVAARHEAEDFVAFVDKLKHDLERFHEKNTAISFEKYNELLKSPDKDARFLGDLKRSLLKLVGILRDLRDGIMEKNRLADLLDESTKHLISVTTQAEIAKVAAQVSHDIRSPLSALEMVLKDLSDLPEDKRILVRSATQRIKDIANNLIDKNRAHSNRNAGIRRANNNGSQAPVVHLISNILDSMVSEKRTQYRGKHGIEIDLGLTEKSYGLFCLVDLHEIKRIVSNLINNAVEALGEKGAIRVRLDTPDEGLVRIQITDNGKGIPQDILSRLGEYGASYDKVGTESGSGLGVYHAKSTIESWGGQFQIDSAIKKGTTVSLLLPRAKAPPWFVEKVAVDAYMKVAVLDDDVSIHQIWDGRFQSTAPNVELVHFLSPVEFTNWFITNKADKYLFDFELLGHKDTGLDLIERLGLSEKAILVTSRFEEPQVQSRCAAQKIGLIPKGLAPLVPIAIKISKKRVDAIVIDDDPLVHMSWQAAAKSRGKSLICYGSYAEFSACQNELDPLNTVYIDSNLGEGIKGEEVSMKILADGFSTIFLMTGFEESAFPPLPHIVGIVDKQPRI